MKRVWLACVVAMGAVASAVAGDNWSGTSEPPPAPPPRDSLSFMSRATAAKTQLDDTQATFVLSGTTNAVRVAITPLPGTDAKPWYVFLRAPGGKTIERGRFEPANCPATDAKSAYTFSLSPIEGKCGTGFAQLGRVHVRQIAFDAGKPVKLELNFVQQQNVSSAPAVVGTLRVKAYETYFSIRAEPGTPTGPMDAVFFGDTHVLEQGGEVHGTVVGSATRGHESWQVSYEVQSAGIKKNVPLPGSYQHKPGAGMFKLVHNGMRVTCPKPEDQISTWTIRDMATWQGAGHGVTGQWVQWEMRCSAGGPAIRGEFRGGL